MCLAQGPQRSDAGEARTRGPWSRVKHSTTEPLRSLDKAFKYADYYPHIGCHYPSDLGYFENYFETNEKRVMGNAFVKIAINIFVPHIMTFTNKCHLCKITKSKEG